MTLGLPCKYGDPTCPCQDGDMCHYEGPNPMTPPREACHCSKYNLSHIKEPDCPWPAPRWSRPEGRGNEPPPLDYGTIAPTETETLPGVMMTTGGSSTENGSEGMATPIATAGDELSTICTLAM